MNNYDSWKLDNGETELICDKCNCKMSENNAVLAIGEFELVCDSCAEDMTYCNCCSSVGQDEDFSYGQEICDNCCDLKADRLADKD